MDLNMQNELSCLLQEINRAKMQLSAIRAQSDKSSSIPGNYVGKIIPSRISGTTPFTATTQPTQLQINVLVGADGPFYAKSIFFNIKTEEGYWFHIHGFLHGFYWGYKVSGSERQRQNYPVPSSLIERSEDGGEGFFEISPHDAFEKNSTVTIFMKFFFAGNDYDASVICAGFNGFYVLG